MNLTPKQLNVLRFIRKFRDAHEYAPTLEEIAREFNVSKITALQHLRALEKRGAVRRRRYQSRSVEIVELPRPHAGRRLRIAGTIAAGAPIEAIEEREALDLSDLIRGRADPFLLRVRGDSMIDEQIREGDYVICERRSSAVNGETVVAILPGGEATLKKFYREPNGRVRLQPANPKLTPTYAERVEIRGVVVGVLRKY
jgi:repressor LexA